MARKFPTPTDPDTRARRISAAAILFTTLGFFGVVASIEPAAAQDRGGAEPAFASQMSQASDARQDEQVATQVRAATTRTVSVPSQPELTATESSGPAARAVTPRRHEPTEPEVRGIDVPAELFSPSQALPTGALPEAASSPAPAEPTPPKMASAATPAKAAKIGSRSSRPELSKRRRVKDHLSEKDLEAVKNGVRKRLSALQRCYERALQDQPGLSGKMTIAMEVAPTGHVSSVDIKRDSVRDPKMAECARKRVEGWRLPPLSEQKPVQIRVPVVFDR